MFSDTVTVIFLFKKQFCFREHEFRIFSNSSIYQIRMSLFNSPVRGQRAFTAIDKGLNSSDIPNTHMDIPYLAIV